MEDPDSADEARPPSTARPSMTPSWIMLGFALGALFVWSLPHPAKPAVPAAPVAAKPEAPPVLAAPRLTAIEAVFEEWGRYAVWENDVTEVALWNSEAKAYTDCFEVLRVADRYYFRSISRLTRPVLTRGIKENSPLQFTEPAAQREEWLRQVREENVRAFTEAAHNTFNPPHEPAVPNPPPPPPQTGPGDGRP